MGGIQMSRKLLIAAALCLVPFIYASDAGAATARLGQMCGGIAGIKCARGLWCELKEGQCRFSDAAGVCARVPRFCIQIFRPVCGCDGKTYPNECVRQSHR